jgi:hypothetical protein
MHAGRDLHPRHFATRAALLKGIEHYEREMAAAAKPIPKRKAARRG